VSETPHALHVRNAPSPAATASLALADLIADRVEAAESHAFVHAHKESSP
jgi:hypothetical protein